MFESWDTFYLLTGTSAAALVGMMFVVTTLTAEIATERVERGIIIYQNPTIFHLGAIFLASALAVMPEHLLMATAALLLILGIVGAVYSALTLRRTIESYEFYRSTLADRAFYGALPCLLYLALAAGAAAAFASSDLAAETIGAAALALLLVSIRNAWDVARFAVRVAWKQRSKDKSSDAAE